MPSANRVRAFVTAQLIRCTLTRCAENVGRAATSGYEPTPLPLTRCPGRESTSRPVLPSGFHPVVLFHAISRPSVSAIVQRSDGNGNYYYPHAHDMEGWLCPALLKYFAEPPKEIYFQVETEAIGKLSKCPSCSRTLWSKSSPQVLRPVWRTPLACSPASVYAIMRRFATRWAVCV